MLRGFRGAIPVSVKRRILTALHLVVGKPVVAAMRERNLELEQVFDQRLARFEARLRATEAGVEAAKSRRNDVDASFRQDLLARQDLLISMLEQRLIRLESRTEMAAANDDARDVSKVANDVQPNYNKSHGAKIAQ